MQGKIKCPLCGSTENVFKNGTKKGVQQYVHRYCPENGGKHKYFDIKMGYTVPAGGEQIKAEREKITEVKKFSISDLRKKHDKFYMIFEEVKKIKKDEFIEETELLKMLGIFAKPGYRAAIDNPALKKYKGKADGVVYYGHPESIMELRREAILI